MEQASENDDFSGIKDATVEILMKKTNDVTKSNECNLCEYASSHAGNLRTHLKTHSGEKENKCNQCEFASSQAGHLRTHLKTHSGEKPYKCNQCDFASSQAGDLRRHLNTHTVKSYTNATSVTMHPPMEAI